MWFVTWMTLMIVTSKTVEAQECDSFESVGDTDSGGRTVIFKKELCSGLEISDTRSIFLVLPSGRRYMVLKYEPAFTFTGYHDKATPSVKWVKAGVLDISIGAVAFVQVQKQHAGDVDVHYEIGEVIIKQ
jgi:hypothetical protein